MPRQPLTKSTQLQSHFPPLTGCSSFPVEEAALYPLNPLTLQDVLDLNDTVATYAAGANNEDWFVPIHRPSGAVGRPSREGYCLFNTLGWSRKLYLTVQVCR